MPLIFGVGIAGGFFGFVVVTGYALWLRFNRRVALLLERIELLQDKEMPPMMHEVSRDVVILKPDLRPDVSADVLRGRTEEVDAIVASGGCAENLIEQTILAVHRNLDRSLSPQDLAGEIHISLRTLQRNLGSVLSCTPRELILSLKMREAYRLLRCDQFNVTEVAMRLGFSSSSHFSRRFKTFYKKNPIDVIQKVKKDRSGRVLEL